MGMHMVIGIVVEILVICIIVVYNKLVSCNNIEKEAFSTMDVYLKKMWKLVPNLVEIAKEYAKHEQEVFN